MKNFTEERVNDAADAPDQTSNGRDSGYDARYPPIGVFETVNAGGRARRIHLLDVGPPDREAFVLIHGASGNLRDFAFEFMESLAAHPAGAGRRIIAIDRPGFGHSDRGPAPGWRPDAQARLMRAAVRQRGVERVYLLGQSLGAVSALAWALDAPETVGGLLDLSGVTHPWPGRAGFSYDVLSTPVLGRLTAATAARFISEARAKASLEPIFAPQKAPEAYIDYIGVGLALRSATIRANGLDIGRLKPFIRGQAARYSEISAPIEIVHGAADVIVPPAIHAIPLARAAPTAELTLLDGVGHMPHHTAREAVLSALGRLLARATP